eukprot:scaffold1173_cov405-Prasinococcus_capsulatus_cf.AAC.3
MSVSLDPEARRDPSLLMARAVIAFRWPTCYEQGAVACLACRSKGHVGKAGHFWQQAAVLPGRRCHCPQTLTLLDIPDKSGLQRCRRQLGALRIGEAHAAAAARDHAEGSALLVAQVGLHHGCALCCGARACAPSSSLYTQAPPSRQVLRARDPGGRRRNARVRGGACGGAPNPTRRLCPVAGLPG